MFSEAKLPASEPARAAGSHSRYASVPSPLKMAGIGEGTHADSRFADEYAFDPTSTRSRPSPAAIRAERTRSPSAHGPNSSKPG